MRGTFLLLGALGLLACDTTREPQRVVAIERPSPELVRLAVGARFSCAIDDDASVRCWGDVPSEVVGSEVEDRVRTPHLIPRFTNVHELAADHDTICARNAERRVLCWGPDVHGDGAGEHPVEVGELHGATSIAVTAGRVCGLIDTSLRCIGTNQPRMRETFAEGAWLEAVDDVVCVLDGVGPARCLESGSVTSWPISGSEGATSIARARGVCATLGDGQLRCDDDATLVVEASLEPVADIEDARFVRGGADVRCVARTDATTCSSPERDDVSFEGEARSLSVGTEAMTEAAHTWHACVFGASGVSCAGTNRVGEVTGHASASVRRVHELPGARPSLAVLRDAAYLIDAAGVLLRVPLDGSAPAPADTELTGWLDLGACEEHLCGRGEGDRLLELRGGFGTQTGVVEGFVATGAPFGDANGVCAPTDGGVLCAEGRDGRTLQRFDGVTHAVPYERGFCALRDGSLVCAQRRWLRDGFRLEPMTDSPGTFEELFGGYEQLFARSRGGTFHAMGHNGVGQLGLPPSRPLFSLTPTASNPFTRMAFAYHLSCGWNDTGPIICAGIGDDLAIRHGAPSWFDMEPDRGDGAWRVIPHIADVVAVAEDDGTICALDVRGGLSCWGESSVVSGLEPPTHVELASH